ncbi:MAG TPA: FAD/NAD(P)-binding protein [Terriglobales bacterium]
MTAGDAHPMTPEPWRIERVRRETHDTFTAELSPANGRRELPFEPGQFNMLYAFGVGEVPISISGDPARTERIVHTTRAVGAVTQAMARLGRGDVLGLRGPFGNRWPVDDFEGSDVVLVAGGIGLAPLRPALYRILARRAEYGRVVLLYGTRTPTDILYLKELEQWRGRLDLDVKVTVDRGMAGWRGDVGVVTRLISRAAFDTASAVALICGPEIMMRFSVAELGQRGLPAERVFVSMERNMKCALGFCGHCQFGADFICKDGPVFPFSRVERLLRVREV